MLAIGNMKVVLVRVIGQEDMERILWQASAQRLNEVGLNQAAVEMNPFRNYIWAALRIKYPIRADFKDM